MTAAQQHTAEAQQHTAEAQRHDTDEGPAKAGSTAARPKPRRGRRGLHRGSLTPELILKESLRLLDEGGTEGFSLPKLGRALGADPTAVYRHFASKDDLVLAIADLLIEEALAGMTPHECWLDTVTDGVRSLRRTYARHPAAASLSACRTTGRPAEMRTVDLILGAVLDAGFEGAEAARIYRAIGDFTLSWAGYEAAFLALDTRAQNTDLQAWTRAYRAVGRAEYPNIWQLRDELPDVSDDDVFETVVSLVIGGLMQRAPRPCGCAHHQQSRQ
jgi:AcrR family transcriptional regulator